MHIQELRTKPAKIRAAVAESRQPAISIKI
jgi:hypothetical protein